MKYTILKILGVLVAMAGVILAVIGIVDFFRMTGWMDGRPELFWLMLIGFPMIGIGGMLLAFGFRPELQRRAQHRMRDLLAATQSDRAICPCCGRMTQRDDNFCPQCGAKMPR